MPLFEPLSADIKRRSLINQGYDPDKFDIDDNTYDIVPRKVAAPVSQPLPTTNVKASAAEAFGRNATLGVVPAAGGLLAGMGTSAIASAPLEMIPPPFGQIAHGVATIGGGILGSLAAAKAQEKVLEQFDAGKQFLANTAQASADQPTAALGGNLAAQLPFMRFSPSMVRDAAKAYSAGKGVVGSIGNVLASPAGQNIAIGTGLGAGSGIYDEIVDPAEFNPGRLALNVLGGTALHKPTALASKLLRVPTYEGGTAKRYEGTVPPRELASNPEITARLGDAVAGTAIEKTDALSPVDVYMQSEVMKNRKAAIEKQLETTRNKALDIETTPDTTAEAKVKLDEEAKVLAAEETKLLEQQNELRKQKLTTQQEQLEAEKLRYENEFKEATREQTPVNKPVDRSTLRALNEATAAQHKGVDFAYEPGKTITTEEGRNVEGYQQGNKVRVASNAGPDVFAHEFKHKFWDEISPSKRREMVEVLQADPEVQKWIAAEREAGRNPGNGAVPAEAEYLAQRTGDIDVARMKAGDSRVLEDLKAWYKTNYATKKASKDDFARWFTNRLTYGRTSRAGDGPVVTPTRTGSVTVETSNADSEQQPAISDIDKLKSDLDSQKLNVDNINDDKGGVEVAIAFYQKARGFDTDQIIDVANRNLSKYKDKTKYVIKAVEKRDERGNVKITNEQVQVPDPKDIDPKVTQFFDSIKGKNNLDDYLKAAKDAGIKLKGQFNIDKGDFNRYSEVEQQSTTTEKSPFQKMRETVIGEGTPQPTREELKAGAEVTRQKDLDLRRYADSEQKDTNDKVVAAAVKVGNKIFTGKYHAEAADKAVDEGYLTRNGDIYTDSNGKRLSDKSAGNDVDLFQTESGKLISRDEAFKKGKSDIERFRNADIQQRPTAPINEDTAEGKRLYEEKFAKTVSLMRDGQLDTPEFKSAWKELEDTKNRYFAGNTPEGYDNKVRKGMALQDKEQTSTDTSTIDTSRKGFFRPLEAQFDQVERQSIRAAKAGRDYEAEQDHYIGWGQDTLVKLQRLSDGDNVQEVVSRMRDGYRAGKKTLDELDLGDIKNGRAVAEQVRTLLHDEFGQERRKLGIEINGREAGLTETYIPDQLSDTALDMFVNKANTPNAKAALREWAQYISDASDSKIPFDQALKDVRDYVQALSGDKNNYRNINFGAIRKAAGFGLPESLRESDPFKNLDKYTKRAAADLAFYKHFESVPEVRAELKLKNPETNEFDAGVEEADNMVPESKEVRDMMKIILKNLGASSGFNPKVNAFARMVNASILGAPTGIRDIVSIPVNSLPYLESLGDMATYFKGMANARSEAANALRYAAKKPQLDRYAFGDLLEAPDTATAIMNKLATGFRKWQGREYLENLGREATFAGAKELARAKVAASRAGDEKATKWLEKFGTLVDMENPDLNQIAKNFVDRVQGTYGGRGLPAGVMEGALSPFLSLQKWGIEKSNVIWKDVIKPAYTGENFIPLLSYSLGTVLTGEAIQELNKILSGRKPQDADLEETLAKATPKNIVSELVTLIQLGNFAGIISDGVKTLNDMVVKGKTPRNMISFPAATTVADLEEKVADYSEAIQQGTDPWEATKMFALDIISHNIQNARAIANHTINADSVERSDKFRDLRVYNELNGEGAGEPIKANKYLDADARKFKQTDDLTEAGEQAQGLLGRFAEKVQENPERAMRWLKGLKSNSYQTAPNPRNNPMEFAVYYEYLVKTQGEKKALERVADYVNHNAINEVKRGMIP